MNIFGNQQRIKKILRYKKNYILNNPKSQNPNHINKIDIAIGKYKDIIVGIRANKKKKR